MENAAYASVFGSGTVSSCPSSTDPFLCSMLPLGSTVPSLNNYGATAADANDFSGCSAACYVGLLAGYTYGVKDGYGDLTAANLVADRFAPAGLTWQAYCESGRPLTRLILPTFSGILLPTTTTCMITASPLETRI